jgi:hypothetical protein
MWKGLPRTGSQNMSKEKFIDKTKAEIEGITIVFSEQIVKAHVSTYFCFIVNLILYWRWSLEQ